METYGQQINAAFWRDFMLYAIQAQQNAFYQRFYVPQASIVQQNQLNEVIKPIPIKIQESQKISETPNGKLGKKMTVEWNDKEDNLLFNHVQQFGQKYWSRIAKQINNTCHEYYEVRLGKHCRERWNNYLNPELNKGKWNREEDVFILEEQQEKGNKWSLIAKNLQGRTENGVKNRWNSLIKQGRKMFGTKSKNELALLMLDFLKV